MLSRNEKSMNPVMNVSQKARRSRFHARMKLIVSVIVIVSNSVTKSAVAVRLCKTIAFLVTRRYKNGTGRFLCGR